MSTTAVRNHGFSAGRRKHTVLAVAALAALSLTATACGTDKDAAKAGVTYSTAPKQSNDLAGQPSSDGDPGIKKAGNGAPDCKTAGLSIKGLYSAPDGKDPVVPRKTVQQHTAVSFVNKSGHKCVLNGFPGITFEGGKSKKPSDKEGTRQWELPRSGDKPAPVTLGPGKTAWAPVTFLSEDEDSSLSEDEDSSLSEDEDGGKDGWYPKKLEVTPPNETRSVTLDWPWGNIRLQDGSKSPGTFVHPLGTQPRAAK